MVHAVLLVLCLSVSLSLSLSLLMYAAGYLALQSISNVCTPVAMKRNNSRYTAYIIALSGKPKRRKASEVTNLRPSAVTQ